MALTHALRTQARNGRPDIVRDHADAGAVGELLRPGDALMKLCYAVHHEDYDLA